MFDIFHNIKDLLNLALNSVNIGILILDEKGHIKFINLAAKKILNLDTNKKDLYLSDISGNAWEEIKNIFKTGKEQIGKREKISGKTLFVQRYPIKYKNKIIAVISFFQHFDEMEKLASELESYRILADELNTIIESVYDGIYVTDGKGKTLRVNSSWERITGLRPEDVVGKTVTELKEKGYISEFVTPQVIEKKIPISIQAKTATGREVLVSGNPVIDKNGNIKMVVTTVRDLSEMRRLSRELLKVKQLTKLYEEKIKDLKRKIVDIPSDIICESKSMQNILDTIIQLRSHRVPVLIQGETGVGKGVVAKLIHQTSFPKLETPFLQINCSAIPETLLEAELFGYEKGAFTGANQKGKPGLFEMADGGTLVLDEIGEIPPNIQAKLLYVLEEYEIKRLGGIKSKKVNVRVICITNRNLQEMISMGKFRQDLFYRINVISIYIPPLRERKEDIIPLIYFFLKKFNKKYNKNKILSKEVVEILYNYKWPGNIRELKNLIERLIIISQNNIIQKNDLPIELYTSPHILLNNPIKPLKKMVQEYETNLIKEIIRRYGGVVKAAQVLKVSPSTLYRKLTPNSQRKP